MESERTWVKLVTFYHFGITDPFKNLLKILIFSLRNRQKCKHEAFCRWLQGAHGHSLVSLMSVLACVSRRVTSALWASVTALKWRQWGWSHRVERRSNQLSTNTQCSNPSFAIPISTWATLWLGSQASSCDSQTLIFYKPWLPHQGRCITAHLTEWIKWDSENPQETLKPWKCFPRHLWVP